METSPQVTKYMKTRGRVPGGKFHSVVGSLCVNSTTGTLIRFTPMGKLQEMELLPSGIG